MAQVKNASANGTAVSQPVLPTPNFFDKGHQIPDKRSQFMKLEYGKNRFRFIGDPISGYVFYGRLVRDDGTETVKPYRRREAEGEFSVEEMINLKVRMTKEGEMERQKYFVMGLVWNYQQEKLQVLEITQKSILKSLKSYVDSEEYGHPAGYDLTMEKKGEGLNTEYVVLPSPPKALDEKIFEEAGAISCDLEKIFEGEYPLG
jgi:hypothetical protein